MTSGLSETISLVYLWKGHAARISSEVRATPSTLTVDGDGSHCCSCDGRYACSDGADQYSGTAHGRRAKKTMVDTLRVDYMGSVSTCCICNSSATCGLAIRTRSLRRSHWYCRKSRHLHEGSHQTIMQIKASKCATISSLQHLPLRHVDHILPCHAHPQLAPSLHPKQGHDLQRSSANNYSTHYFIAFAKAGSKPGVMQGLLIVGLI